MKKELINTPKVWEEKWKNYFEHYQQDLRHAYYINALRDRKEVKVLELFAGSFRDVNYLNEIGVDCYGMDFADSSIQLAKERFFSISHKFKKMDAFHLKYKDKEFDLTYHNGGWVLFEDETSLKQLAQEQARISKHRMMVTVHNAHNQEFKSYFDRLAVDDSLYNVRFFYQHEVEDLLSPYCDDIITIPVGKGKRYHEDWLIKWGITNPFILRNYLKMMKDKTLESSERLLCIGKIKKQYGKGSI